ncbi:MAG: putative Ig domain-containing protein, partial [Deltaproteobacteria bacterium]|nr:putative Ig domain-containing protein [Deltaproteobacteria bacterium]
MNRGIGTRHGAAGIIIILILAFAAFAGSGLFATDSHAYSDYASGCDSCHGSFTGSTSPKGTNFGAAGNKHDMHRNSSFMGTACGLCHTTNGDSGSMTTSRGETGVAGRGCTGCHNAAGLRNHHRTTGASTCSCHGSAIEAAPAESTPPLYYGTSATRANNTCNAVAQANVNENWSSGDFLGLDNDGDNLYDTNDPNCQAVVAPTITTASPLPAGTVGTAYSQTLAATGGTPPYSWSVSSGSLPAGLSLSSAGVLSGTPTTAATSGFTVQVTGGGTATKAFSVTINAAAAVAPTISTASLPAGTVGTAYSQTLAATGGTTPYSWSVSAGTLPAGLSLSTGGVLSGTPTAAATSSFTVQVTGGGTATKPLSVTINPEAPSTGAVTITPEDGATNVPVNTVVTASVGTGDIRTVFN